MESKVVWSPQVQKYVNSNAPEPRQTLWRAIKSLAIGRDGKIHRSSAIWKISSPIIRVCAWRATASFSGKILSGTTCRQMPSRRTSQHGL